LVSRETARGDHGVRGETRLCWSVLNVVDWSCATIKGTEWKLIKLDSDITLWFHTQSDKLLI
jgi:hypothetical protein